MMSAVVCWWLLHVVTASIRPSGSILSAQDRHVVYDRVYNANDRVVQRKTAVYFRNGGQAVGYALAVPVQCDAWFKHEGTVAMHECRWSHRWSRRAPRGAVQRGCDDESERTVRILWSTHWPSLRCMRADSPGN